MFIKDNFNLLHEQNLLLHYKRHKFIKFKPRIGYMFVFVLMMSLMLEVSSNHNQSVTTIRARRVKGYNRSSQITTNITTTTSSTITSKAEFIKGTRRRKAHSINLKDKTTAGQVPTSGHNKQAVKRKSTRNSKKRMRFDMQQQQQYHHNNERQREQRQRHQQQLASAGETAYLVERANDDNDDDARRSVQEQPIYGTWRTKAKRLQVPTATTTAAAAKHTNELNASTTAVEPTTLAAAQITVSNAAVENDYHHVYERLPRRSATMTPLRNELHDQLPRPPRLTSRRPSLLVRRQYLETPLNVSYSEFEQKPKPFHFPFEGPLPAEFKKAQPERAAELNNIQEILQQLHLNGAASAAAVTRSPQLVMLPTGLHVAGSFKNFKSSGIANFFRNKRNKKQVQLSFPLQMQPLMQVPKPLPIQYYNSHQHGPPSFYGAAMAQQPYQRIAMDQFYAFKPRSPNEINLLAMQQQLNAKRVKNKKKKAPLPLINAGQYVYNNSIQLLNNQRPDHFVPYYPPQWLLMNATQKPNQKLKRIPFKVNLDIFPVLPPTKNALLRNPYMVDYGAHQYPQASPQQQQPQFNELNFMRIQQQKQQQEQQTNSAQIIFPDQIPKYTQQQFSVQQDPFQRQPLNPQQNSFTPIDFDCIEPQSNENEPPNNGNGNQIMLHLNVFPKPRSTTTPVPLPSTNPFYSNVGNNHNNRNTNEANESQALAAAVRDAQNLSRQTAYANDTLPQFYPKPQRRRVSRSDDNYATLVDFEHPIVAADVSELPKAAAIISNKLDTSDITPYYDHIETRNNFNTEDSEPSIDQLSSEARTASLFRYPVEDLIQFQVDDAL